MSETSELPSTRTWDGAASPPASDRAARFETAWKAAKGPASRPSPRDYLPDDPKQRPGVLLALLRAELTLRHDAGEAPRVEDYERAYPELDEDGLVALIYEDFCLREETGDSPVPVEYEERFPTLIPRLRRVFDIHDLVGSSPSIMLPSPASAQAGFPEVGQTIAGFHLRDELGRGSFARVFLAEERQLADRPVALKVARTGSREPQTLARLQHTHIVPVYSYRTDPATGLHLLCMPFFGRITLERLLARPAMRTARTGADVLDALDRLEPPKSRSIPTRNQFSQLPFAKAVAWWGARMAEALAHAHERGVMHRDVKPSNVLITSDGLPMLLDFNLAREPWEIESAKADTGALGGTLAYMAPEHLDAIAERNDDKVDGRADLYSLGVLLFETLTSRRPFSPPKPGESVAETLRRAAEERRAAVTSIRGEFPETPAALEAIVLRCLEPDPALRHANASELAADLQAVVDEDFLPHTREPLAGRARRWASRHRFGLTLTIPMLILAWLLLNFAREARQDQTRTAWRINRLLEEGAGLERVGNFTAALAKYEDAANLASDQPFFHARPPLAEGFREASGRRLNAKIACDTAANVARFFGDLDASREEAIRRPRTLSPRQIERLDELIARFASVATKPRWTEFPAFAAVSPNDRSRLEREYEEILLRRAAASRRESVDAPTAYSECVRIGRASTSRPWLWDLLESRVRPHGDAAADRAAAYLAEWSGFRREALDLWKHAADASPGDFWCRRQFAGLLREFDRDEEALRQLDLALAIRPEDAGTLEARADLLQKLGRWDESRENLRRARKITSEPIRR